jgi:hypothetical protein
MILNEIFEIASTGFTDTAEDNTIPKLSDVRKTRLSLDQINKLRIMNDVRKLEDEKRLADVSRQYSQKQ